MCPLALIAAAVALPAAPSLKPEQLRCEYRVNPAGIDTTEPRLSWVLSPVNPKARGLRQTAYRILVASTEASLRANIGDLWDTGRVQSSESIQVAYRGNPLASGMAAYWKVQVWDQDAQNSEWSGPAQWSMGLLSSQDWHGEWIGRDDGASYYRDPASVYAPLLRAKWIWDMDGAQRSAPAGDRYFRATLVIDAGR